MNSDFETDKQQPIYKTPAPTPLKAIADPKYVLSIIVVVVAIPLLVMLLVVLKPVSLPPLFIAGFVGFSFLGLGLFIRRLNNQPKKIFKNLQEDQYIEVYPRQLIVPHYLLIRQDGRKIQPGVKVNIDLSAIKDFEAVPGSKNSPNQFVIKQQNFNGVDQKIYLYNTLNKNQVDELFKAMHRASGFDERRSPFSQKARDLRGSKRKMIAFVTLIATFSFALSFTAFLLCQPLFWFTGGMHYALYSLPLALLSALLMRSTVLHKAFKKGFGQQMPFPLLLVATFSCAWGLVGVSNYYFHSVAETRELSVLRTYRVSSKSSYNYYAEFVWQGSDERLLFKLNEQTQASIKRSEYNKLKKMKKNKGQIQVTVAQGLLGVPVILNSKVLIDEGQ